MNALLQQNLMVATAEGVAILLMEEGHHVSSRAIYDAIHALLRNEEPSPSSSTVSEHTEREHEC